MLELGGIDTFPLDGCSVEETGYLYSASAAEILKIS